MAFGGRSSRDSPWRWGMSTGIVTEYPVGTLIVDLVDAATNEMVWRSVASDTIPSKPEKGRKRLDKVATKMFKVFPSATGVGTAN